MVTVPFKIKVVKVGHSLKITIPKPVTDHLNIKAGDSVSITVISKTVLQVELMKKS